MALLKPRTWSERQQVVAIIMMAAVLLFVLWSFPLTAMNRMRRSMEQEIQTMQNRLAEKNYLRGEDALQKEKREEYDYAQKLGGEWVSLARRLAGFQGDVRLDDAEIIDYKMALFKASQRLKGKSDSMGISLPDDLGLPLGVSQDEARQRILQLRAVEKIVDMGMDAKFRAVKNIDLMPILQHRLGEDEEPFVEEYPVCVEFDASLQNLYDFLHVGLEPEHMFVLRRLRVEKSPAGRGPDLLRVKAVMSSLLFVRDPKEFLEIPKFARRSRPTGY